jgi:hypothetical protein
MHERTVDDATMHTIFEHAIFHVTGERHCVRGIFREDGFQVGVHIRHVRLAGKSIGV